MTEVPSDIPKELVEVIKPLMEARPDLVAATQRVLNDLRVLSSYRYNLPHEILSKLGINVTSAEHANAKMALKLLKTTKPGEASTAREAAERLIADYFTKAVKK